MTQSELASARPVPGEEAEAGSYKLGALATLSEVTASLAGDYDVEALLARFLATLIRLAGASAGAVRVLTSDGKHLRLVSAIGLPPEVKERERLVPIDCGACGTAIRDDAIAQVRDATPCRDRTGLPWFDRCRGIAVVPLAHRGRVLGEYNLFLTERREVPAEVAALFRSIGEHLGMALENARLQRENLRMTVMGERALMANEVHDSLAQTMAYMKMRLAMMVDALGTDDRERALKYAGDMQHALGEAYADLRELLGQFRSRMDPLGLVHALEAVATGFAERNGIALEVTNGITDLNLSVDEETQVYHIVHEALSNVARHAGATRAQLTMARSDGDYEFTVEDDGLGFFALGNRLGGFEEHPGLRHHLGINIMRERAQRLNGRIEIANLPGRGARVRLVFPADPAQRVAHA
jgi:two-component system nitrate/nitrite sensor histidine kinase NarX